MGRGARRRPKYLATKLREIRWGLGGLSQDALIERLGLMDYVNRGEISDFERGVREPDLLTLKAYADGAGVLVDDLIDDDVKLPEKMPAAKHAEGLPQKRRMKATMNTTTVKIWLRIENKDHVASEENRARRNIEKSHLKRYGMDKLNDSEYELTFSYQGDADLDEQIYALLGAIKNEAKGRKCSIKVNVREKGADRYW
jgi:transcriptional regulator with XRE-family HTH domain